MIIDCIVCFDTVQTVKMFARGQYIRFIFVANVTSFCGENFPFLFDVEYRNNVEVNDLVIDNRNIVARRSRINE